MVLGCDESDIKESQEVRKNQEKNMRGEFPPPAKSFDFALDTLQKCKECEYDN